MYFICCKKNNVTPLHGNIVGDGAAKSEEDLIWKKEKRYAKK